MCSLSSSTATPLFHLKKNMVLAMASLEVVKAPQCPELPALPSDTFWTESQWAVFMAIMDTIIPSIVPKSCLADTRGQLGLPDADYQAACETACNAVVAVSTDKAVRAYLEDRPSTDLAVRGAMVRVLAQIPSKQRDGLGKLMSSLSCVLSSQDDAVLYDF